MNERKKNLTPEEWREQLTPFDPWNRRLILATFAALGIPGSYLDVGCGTGSMTATARALGVDSLGVDAIARPPDKYYDLTAAMNLGRDFDLVTCVEVAEHIPMTHTAVFCGNVARHVMDGGLLIFTAAAPGQAGDGHVNLRMASEWRSFFYQRRLHYQEHLTYRLKLAWQTVPMPMMWLTDNLQVFHKVPIEGHEE